MRPHSLDTELDRFWSCVQILGKDDCWPWMGNLKANGYGRFHTTRKSFSAHRYAYEVSKGPIPDGLLVRHTCDNKYCVNPAHLLTGTSADNSKDMVERGRSLTGDRNPGKHFKKCGDENPSRLHPECLRRGESHPNSKLCDWDVRFIRHWLRRDHVKRHVAEAFGISEYPVHCISKNRYWRHVA